MCLKEQCKDFAKILSTVNMLIFGGYVKLFIIILYDIILYFIILKRLVPRALSLTCALNIQLKQLLIMAIVKTLHQYLQEVNPHFYVGRNKCDSTVRVSPFWQQGQRA